MTSRAAIKPKTMPSFKPALVAVAGFGIPFSETMTGIVSQLWLAIVAAAMLSAFFRGASVRPYGGVLWIIAAYAAMLGVIGASANAHNLTAHIAVGAQVILFMGVGPFAVKRLFATSPKIANTAVGAFLLAQTLSAGASAAQAAGIPGFGATLVHGRAAGLSGHPNILGMLSGVAVVVFLHLLVKGGRRRLLLIVGLTINAIGLLTSGSVSALIACGVGLLVLLLALRVRPKVVIPALAVGVAAYWAITSLASTGLFRGPLQRIMQVTGQTGETSTWAIRQNTYAYAWEGIQNDPIYGRGLDDTSGATFDQLTVTHNVLLRAWFQGGFGMGLAFAIIYALIIVTIIRSIIGGRNHGAIAALSVVLAFSFTSAALQQPYFWLVILGAWAFVEAPPKKLQAMPPAYQRSRAIRVG